MNLVFENFYSFTIMYIIVILAHSSAHTNVDTPVHRCRYGHTHTHTHTHTLVSQDDCLSYPNPESLLGCAHGVWLSLALYPLQSVILFIASFISIALFGNFKFEVSPM